MSNVRWGLLGAKGWGWILAGWGALGASHTWT